MPRSVAPGATDQSEYFYVVQDVGGAAPGEPKTGLTHSDLTSAYYTRTRGSPVQITGLSTLAAANSAHADGGFKEVDGTNLPGVYRFDPPDAAYASGAAEVVIGLLVAGAANAVARPIKVCLDAPQTGDGYAALVARLPSVSATVNASPSPTTTAFALNLGPGYNNDHFIGALLYFEDGNCALESTKPVTAVSMTGNVGTVTVGTPFQSTPTAGDTARVLLFAHVQAGVNVTSWRGDTPDTLTAGRLNADVGGVNGSDDDIEALAEWVANIDPGTGAAPANVVDIDTDVITAAAIHAGAVTKIQTGLATSAEVIGLNVNTRAVVIVPEQIEIADGFPETVKISLSLYDELGNMEAPDSTPTVALVNAGGTDLSSRLSSASNPSTGVYTWDYTSTNGDAEEQIYWTFTVVEGGATRTYRATSYVVERTIFRFSSSDRLMLSTIHAKLPQKTTITGTDNVSGDLEMDDATGNFPGSVGSVVSKTGYSLSGTVTTFDALVAALNTAHGSGSWATATGFSTHSAADVWSVVARTLTAGTNIQLPSNGLANVIAWTVAITGNITGNLSGTVGTVNALANNVITTASIADGAFTDAKFTLPTEATGTPSTLLQLIMWIAGMLGWRKVVKDSGAGTVTQFMADNSAVKTVSTYTSDAGVDTLNKASGS